MNREELLQNLNYLDGKLRKNTISGELYVFGGAAMCLDLNARQFTNDIDAIFKPESTIKKFISEIADEYGLPSNWMSDSVKLFDSPLGTFERFGDGLFTNLKVFMATPSYLFAMKMLGV